MTMIRTTALAVATCLMAGAAKAAISGTVNAPEFKATDILSAMDVNVGVQSDTAIITAYMFLVPAMGATITCILNATAIQSNVGSEFDNIFTFNALLATSPTYVLGCDGTASHGQYVSQFGFGEAGDTALTNISGSPFNLDGYTEPPTLVQPVDNETYTNTELSVKFQISENADLSSLRLRIYNATWQVEMTLNYALLYVGLTYTTRPVITDPTEASTIASISPLNATIPEGVYTFTFGYRDTVGNAEANATAYNVKIDTFTEVPNLIGWETNGVYGNPITIQYTLPEPPVTGSVLIAYADSVVGDALTRTQVFVDDLAVTYVWDRTTLATNPPVIQNAGLDIGLPDGTYNITLQYSDEAGNDLASTSADFVTFDSVTNTPLLHSAVQSLDVITITFTLPEEADNDQMAVILNNDIQAFSRTLLVDITGIYTINVPSQVQFSVSDPRSSSSVISMTPIGASDIQDSTYTVQVQYSDVIPNPSATSNTYTMLVDTVTRAVVVTEPTTNSTIGQSSSITLTATDVPLADTVTATWAPVSGPGSQTVVMTLHVDVATEVTMTLDAYNVTSSPSITASSPNTLVHGTVYNVQFQYQDTDGNPLYNTTVSNVNLDTETNTPSIFKPLAGTTITGPFDVTYYLPETASTVPGDVAIIFQQNLLTYTWMLEGGGLASGSNITINVDPLDITAAEYITSTTVSDTLYSGTYTVSVSYKDVHQNDASSYTLPYTVEVNTVSLLGNATECASNVTNTVYNGTTIYACNDTVTIYNESVVTVYNGSIVYINNTVVETVTVYNETIVYVNQTQNNTIIDTVTTIVYRNGSSHTKQTSNVLLASEVFEPWVAGMLAGAIVLIVVSSLLGQLSDAKAAPVRYNRVEDQVARQTSGMATVATIIGIGLLAVVATEASKSEQSSMSQSAHTSTTLALAGVAAFGALAHMLLGSTFSGFRSMSQLALGALTVFTAIGKAPAVVALGAFGAAAFVGTLVSRIQPIHSTLQLLGFVILALVIGISY